MLKFEIGCLVVALGVVLGCTEGQGNDTRKDTALVLDSGFEVDSIQDSWNDDGDEQAQEVAADSVEEDTTDTYPDPGSDDPGPSVCIGVVCSNHGYCTERNGRPLCNCDPGYEPKGLDCVLKPPPGQVRILFDAGHGVTAGNADWRIDNDSPRPQPPNPHDEQDWDGAISRWAFELYKAGGYEIYNSTRRFTITYGRSGELDLQNFDIVVCCEPNDQFSASEKQALVRYVKAGGKFILVIDHANSDRDHDGWDSPRIAKDLFEDNGVQRDPFGITLPVDQDKIGVNLSGKLKVVNNSSPVIDGAFGMVRQVNFHNGTYFSIDRSKGVIPLVWYGYSQSDNRVAAAIVPYGKGWFALVGDSSPVDDGTGTGGKLYDGWGEADDGAFLMNLTDFLRRQ